MSGFIFLLLLRLVEYLVACILCLVYVKVGPGGEYLGNILDVAVGEFVKIDWHLIAHATQDNVAAMFAEVAND